MGRSLKAEEIANDLKMTRKAVERALAKLYEKRLVRRSSFRRGAYFCDLRSFTLCILLFCSDLHAQYLKKKEVLV
jgi:DNA-binding transcriptional ArsR family regulator